MPSARSADDNPAITTIARAVSIIGHPIVLVLAAALFTAASQGASARQLRIIGGSIGVLSVIALVFSAMQVRAGRWRHVDASDRRERASLNVFLALLLMLAALVTWLTGRPMQMAIALVLSASLVIVALLTARWVKMSLHVSFAAFSTTLVWPSMVAMIVGVALTAAIAWSRLVLRRHVVADVVIGAVLGTATGIAYQASVP